MTQYTRIEGITYVVPPAGSAIEGRDGRARFECGGLPLPVREEDRETVEAGLPGYDAAGRGFLEALLKSPGCMHARRYAEILREHYPHLVAEISTQTLMLDKKDVDPPYRDRMIRFMRVLSLLSPEDRRLKIEIGLLFKEKGLDLRSLHDVTRSLYSAEKYLREGCDGSEDARTLVEYGEVEYLLGRYQAAVARWEAAIPSLTAGDADALRRRIEGIRSDAVPHVPAVDYLEALSSALEAFRERDFEEAGAIINDVFSDSDFAREFPLPAIRTVLGKCYEEMTMPRYAEEAYRAALEADPADGDARSGLDRVRGRG